MRYRAVIAYDGTAFYGFQRQKTERTIQGELEAALERIGGQGAVVYGAGRTDTGVHASGQVIAFDLDWKHTTDALVRALNVNLPEAIRVLGVDGAAADFNPRFAAISRTYRYRIYQGAVVDPLRRLYVWHLPYQLNVAVMQDAAETLIGTHDFRTFGTPPHGDNSVRTVLMAHWDTAGDEYHFTISANAFLFRMVRRIVGTLVMVGQGVVTVDVFRGILAAREPKQAGTPAPPQGLTLIGVGFPENNNK